MAHALRHDPDHYKISLNQQGWVYLSSLAKGISASEDEVRKIVGNSDKRFDLIRLDENTAFVRAKYGHSVSIVREPMEAARIPVTLYYVAGAINTKIIQSSGIGKPGGKLIRVYSNSSLARSRYRGGEYVKFSILGKQAFNQGNKFYLDDQKAIWTDYVSPEVIQIIEGSFI